MSRKNMTMAIWSLVKPLRDEGIKVSAHSFRKRFLNDWRRDRQFLTGKYIAGKKIPQNDDAYVDIERDYFEDYMEHYFKYITLDPVNEELETIKDELKRARDEYIELVQGLRNYAVVNLDVIDDVSQAVETFGVQVPNTPKGTMRFTDYEKMSDVVKKRLRKGP